MAKQYFYTTFGEGDYTFVCDAGMGNWSVFFKPLCNELIKFSRVCLIDRPGYTTDYLPDTPRDCRTIAGEIDDVLTQMGITQNLVLVGHSLGGLNMRMYQHLYPEKVKGMVLLDAAHPHMLEVIPEVKTNLQIQIKQVNRIINIARWGLLRFAKKRIPTFGLPKELLKEYYRVTTKAQYYRLYKMEMEVFEDSLNQCRQLKNLGSLPLLVIYSNQGLNKPINEPEKENETEDTRWVELQKDLTTLSSQSTFIESEDEHFFHLTDYIHVALRIRNFYNDDIKVN